jgi:hypothetical protein
MANRNLDTQERAFIPQGEAHMVIAYLVPHNDGVEFGVITGPGFDTELTLIDLYEVDATVKSVRNEPDARDWLEEKFAELNIDLNEVKTEDVPGGSRGKVRY